MIAPSLALALLPFLQDPTPADHEVVRLFVFAGQSNMEGADTQAAKIDGYPTFVGAGKKMPEVRYWYMLGRPGPKHDSKGWIPLGPDHHGRFGPELTFGRAVDRHIRPPIAIVKSAWGGTTLAKDWDPDAPSEKRLFARTLELIRKAQADLTKRGLAHRLEAFVWHQGENDMLNRKLMHGYGKRLEAFIARWRKELDAPDLRWFIGEISGKGIWGLDHRRNMQIVRAQQKAVADADPRVWFVPTSHLAFKVMDKGQPHYHFGTEGQLQHGIAYAQAYLKTIGANFPRGPIGPQYGVSPYRSGDKIRVFVIAGQRSAEGDGCYTAAIPDGKMRIPLTSIPFHARVAGGLTRSFVPLGPVNEHGTFGPELSIGWTLQDNMKGEQIAIIKVTHSAAALADWLPAPENASRSQYRGAVAFIHEALRLMRTGSEDTKLEAVFWIPGEHDAWWGPFRKRYAEDLTTLVTAMRKDLKAPELKWIVAELADNMVWGSKRLDELDAQIARAAEADPLMWFVPTDSIKTPEKSVTFGAKGTIALGELLARHYLRVR